MCRVFTRKRKAEQPKVQAAMPEEDKVELPYKKLPKAARLRREPPASEPEASFHNPPVRPPGMPPMMPLPPGAPSLAQPPQEGEMERMFEDLADTGGGRWSGRRPQPPSLILTGDEGQKVFLGGHTALDPQFLKKNSIRLVVSAVEGGVSKYGYNRLRGVHYAEVAIARARRREDDCRRIAIVFSTTFRAGESILVHCAAGKHQGLWCAP